MTQLQALLLTVVIEVVVVFALVGLLSRPWMPRLIQITYISGLFTLAAAVAAASLLTHPFAWWLNGELMGQLAFFERAFLIEASVVVAEAFLYAWLLDFEPFAALTVALVANLASFSLGLWLYYNVFVAVRGGGELLVVGSL